MFDTTVTVVGNVLNTPEFKRLTESQVVVANFKIAATSRRYDKASNRWVDGASLRVRVNCWRRLAENVGKCVNVGDPVIVTGRLYSRDWEGEDHVKRVSYELDAVAVGHDLARGRARFTRWKPSMATSEIDDAERDNRVNGEAAETVVELNTVNRRREYDSELGGFITTVEDDPNTTDPFVDDALAELREVDVTADPFSAAEDESEDDGDDGDDADDSGDSGDDTGATAEPGRAIPPARKRRPRRLPVPA